VGFIDMESVEGGLYGVIRKTIVWKWGFVDVLFVWRGSLCRVSTLHEINEVL
jgi:hypothetical protein